MNELYEKVKEELSIVENMYDIIRIIDPINKNILNIKTNENNKSKKLMEKCYNHFNKGTMCCNCISMRANIENDTIVKLEYDSNKVILMSATPVNFGEEIYIVEMIKDISSKNSKISNTNYKFDKNVRTMINDINEKIIRDNLTGVYNRTYIEGRLPVDLNNSVVNKYLLSTIMIYIDEFKNVNNKYGQDVEKKILNDVSNLISDLVAPDSYWVGRYSGNKFIVVLNDTDKEEACKISDQLRFLFEDISYKNKSIRLNASFSSYCSEGEITDIKNILTELEKDIIEEKQKKIEGEINKEKKLSTLNYRIQELREILNEMCMSSEETLDYEQTLKVSQDLDELIVEYMKNAM